MKRGLYPRLAVDGLRKNKRLVLPYLMTGSVLVMMQYIITFLSRCEALSLLWGSEFISETLRLGSIVLAVFSALFLFYSHSFLMRRRKKEFGLYHVLGMDKKNIGRVLLWETLATAVCSLFVGLGAGVALSKLAELILVRLVRGETSYAFTVGWTSLGRTAAVFLLIYLLLFFNALRQIYLSDPIALLQSESAGEKPPRANWLLGLLGVCLLAAAYAIALLAEDAIRALAVFFVAVLLVIAATYLLLIFGSVLLCRLLQKNKKYYYRAKAFVSVSSMAYRMRRNGAGLASVCVLATMVLVMLSSTACLYFGEEEVVSARYPRDINVTCRMSEPRVPEPERIAAIRSDIDSFLTNRDAAPQNAYAYQCALVTGALSGAEVETDVRLVDTADSLLDMRQFCFISLEAYNERMGAAETLADGEILISVDRGAYRETKLSFHGGRSFTVKRTVDSFVGDTEPMAGILSTMTVVVPDLAKALNGLDRLADYNGDPMVHMKWVYCFDVEGEEERQIGLYQALSDTFSERAQEGRYGSLDIRMESRQVNRQSFYSIDGGLFFLGLLLSFVFVLAATLIIYYKQISEGYEDRARFLIMRKIGMTKRDIRRSVDSQMLTVFFAPLFMAVMHLTFAFPIICRLLRLFNLNNPPFFALVTVVCVCIFALCYALVYRLTSNAYYRIVSGFEGEDGDFR